jgi:signal transduction histidine kinase
LHEEGLAAALEWLAAETRKSYNVEVTLEADSSANPETADVRIFLFRAVRELLLNSVKHSAGSAVHITMQHLSPDKVRVIVADDGPGFDRTSLDTPATDVQKFGLFNIRERVQQFGGEFNIKSSPNRGTRITLSLFRGSAQRGSDRPMSRGDARQVSSVSTSGARQRAARSGARR